MKKRAGITFKLYYQLEVRDATGKVTWRSRRRLSQSWLEQFSHILRLVVGNITSEAVVDSASVSRTLRSNGTTGFLANSASFIGVAGLAGDINAGINIGTGTTAVSITQRSLITPIAHGTGGSQMEYGATTINVVSVVAPDATFDVNRTFTNNSGASITVQEIGLIGSFGDTAVITRVFQLARDTTGAVAVANTSTLTGKYIIKVTV